jgi:hypothetical protein
MAKSEKQVVALWRSAVKLAGACVVENSGLPDKQEITAIACALLAAGLVTGGKDTGVYRAGQDADQDAMLSDAYDTGSQVGR